jgi:hypothetical protein
MKSTIEPYSVPRKLEPGLARVLAYWQGLKRGENEMPFWDDVNLSMLPDLSDRLMLIVASDRPVRFRFTVVGKAIRARYRGDLDGKFLDEIGVRDPLQYLHSQSSATVERRAPTYYRSAPGQRDEGHSVEGYSRLLLPMWGDGHIGMLLGAIDQE